MYDQGPPRSVGVAQNLCLMVPSGCLESHQFINLGTRNRLRSIPFLIRTLDGRWRALNIARLALSLNVPIHIEAVNPCMVTMTVTGIMVVDIQVCPSRGTPTSVLGRMTFATDYVILQSARCLIYEQLVYWIVIQCLKPQTPC